MVEKNTMIGLDTGFFFELLMGNTKAIEIWKDIIKGTNCVTSCLTFFELKRLSLRGLLDPNDLKTLLESVMAISDVVWLDNIDIHEIAANLSHGTGIPAIDSLILSSLIISGVKIVYTTESHFKSYQRKDIQIVIL